MGGRQKMPPTHPSREVPGGCIRGGHQSRVEGQPTREKRRPREHCLVCRSEGPLDHYKYSVCLSKSPYKPGSSGQRPNTVLLAVSRGSDTNHLGRFCGRAGDFTSGLYSKLPPILG